MPAELPPDAVAARGLLQGVVAGGAADRAVLALVLREGPVGWVGRALHLGLLAGAALMPVHAAAGAAPAMLARIALQPGHA